jgi:hypothetical protein
VITVFPELPGWRFSSKETSAGVYEVLGVDRHGRRVVRAGDDSAAALDWCRGAAGRMLSIRQAIRRVEDAIEAGGPMPAEGTSSTELPLHHADRQRVVSLSSLPGAAASC